ncbi:MAG: hypothetical protein WC655_26890 [Candidatus Hydrogenedentales bacterium]|jgi:hypothetical protein
MTSQSAIEERLESLGEELRAAPSVVNEVMARVTCMPAPARKKVRSSRRVRWTLAMAACGAVAVCVYGVLLGNPFSVRSRAVAALTNARTIHAVGLALQADGSWMPEFEMWYERNKGVREHVDLGDRRKVFLDDGTYRWEHLEPNRFVVRRLSVDPSGHAREVLDVDRLLSNATRLPAEDKVVGGEPWRCYQTGGRGKYWEAAWLDPEWRVRAFEERRQVEGGGYETYRTSTVDYDAAISQDQFSLELGDGVQVVDATNGTALQQAFFNPEDATAKLEIIGLNLVVHRCLRVEGGWALVVASARPSPKALETCGLTEADLREAWLDLNFDWWPVYAGPSEEPERPSFNPILYRPSTPKSQYFDPLPLADVKGYAFMAAWTLIRVPETVQDSYDAVQLRSSVQVHFRLEEAWKKQGWETFKRNVSMEPVPVSGKPLRLDQVLRQVYQDASLLEGALKADGVMVQVNVKPVASHTEKGENGEDLTMWKVSEWPSDITEQTFISETHLRVEELPSVRGQMR